MTARELWFTAPRQLELRSVRLNEPTQDEVLVNTDLCGISAGTEGLLWRGEFPADLLLDETIPELRRPATYPCPYGYTLVGHTGPGSEPVLVFHPHADRTVVSRHRLIRLPAHWTPEQGVFLPNTETAYNLILDAAPRAGERVVVMGLGIVGLIATAMLAEFPLAQLLAVDPAAGRRERVSEFARVIHPDRLADELGPGGADVILELSGSPPALQAAVDAAGFAGRIIVGSWYGSKEVRLDLGRSFHRRRLTIVSSQVSTISPVLSGRWDHHRRLESAINWLDRHWDPAWVTRRIPLDRAGDAYRLIDSPEKEWLQLVLVP